MIMSVLLSVSIAVLAGLLMTRVFKPLKLPSVTAYLIAGVLIGPYGLGALHIDGLGFTSAEAVSDLSLISEVALGFIAFAIGNEFRLKSLKATGRQAAVIGVVDLFSILVNPLIEIAASLALGAVMGWLLTQLEKLFNSNTNRLNLTIAFVFLTASLAMVEVEVGPVTIGFSSLLVCMMLGTVFCNLCPLSDDLMAASDRWTSPLFALFFVISGAELELSVFTDGAIVCIGLVYILFRSAGKYLGAYASAKWTNCAPNICKYLGITLLPQAGVALGMCTTAMQLGDAGTLIRNITLFSVLVYELVGPLLTKQALTRAGDIQPKSEEVINRRKIKLAAAESARKQEK